MSFRNDGAEHRLWLLLHHLYSAVALWEQASDEERQVVEALRVKLQFFIRQKCHPRKFANAYLCSVKKDSRS